MSLPRQPPDSEGRVNVYSGITIEGGRNVLGNVYHAGEEFDSTLRSLSFSADALYNSYSKQHDPFCLEGTRVTLLKEIESWICDQDACPLLWLNGTAGTGKTTIARTIANQCHLNGRLAGSFFFSRGASDTGQASKFVTTIALQLAQNIPGLRERVQNAASQRTEISSLSIRDQWNDLIVQPLSHLGSDDTGAKPFLLVVDALDECASQSDISVIIQLLSGIGTHERSHLKVLVVSREETVLRRSFAQISQSKYRVITLQDIPISIVDQDISAFFTYKLGIIRQDEELEAEWPGTTVIKQLVQRASGLFIWAATACRFISEGPFPELRLQALLGKESHAKSRSGPEEYLSNLYHNALTAAIDTNWSRQEKELVCELQRRILGTIVLQRVPLSLKSLAKLLGIPYRMVEKITQPLHSVLSIPSQHTEPVRLHHPLFRDFLLDKTRRQGPSICVDRVTGQNDLAERCVHILSERTCIMCLPSEDPGAGLD